MLSETIKNLIEEGYTLPELPEEIPGGDMPGDKIRIFEDAGRKARLILPELLKALAGTGQEKAVIAFCGGSGAGKTTIAAVMRYYLDSLGIGSYVLSGDNYPIRIPVYNDAERLNIFRRSGIRGMLEAGVYTDEIGQQLMVLQEQEKDADPEAAENFPWLSVYQEAGRKALAGYLGTGKEIDFDELSGILASFKEGREKIFLKRLGRTDTALWYEETDLSGVQALILEWTHGNSDELRGVDVPILLNSTPEETLAYRKARNRDGKTDSPFTSMVLAIEQKKLHLQAGKAKIIISREGELLDFAAYSALMNGKFDGDN